MKPVAILTVSGGLNMLSPDTDLPVGDVREATNLVIHDEITCFDRRDGTSKQLSGGTCHSLWRSQDATLTLFMSAGALYRLTGTGSAMAAAQLATGFWSAPARYAELGGNVYVSAGKIIRIDPDLSIHIPGVADLSGFTPTLTATAGLLDPGIYGVAFSAVNGLGEESGLSGIEWIADVTGGLTASLPSSAVGDAVTYRIYRTAPNGDQLYLASEIPVATGTSLISGETGRHETTWMLGLMPAGSDICAYRGRLYAVLDSFLYHSEPFNPGLRQLRSGFTAFEDEINMVQPVANGIYVGTDSRIYFLSGTSPTDFVLKTPANNGAVKHSNVLVQANFVGGKANEEPYAVWFSPHGYQTGSPDGVVSSPQAERILVTDATRAPTVAMIRNGIPQLLSAVEGLTMGTGGSADITQ